MRSGSTVLPWVLLLSGFPSCQDFGSEQPAASLISSDAALFRHVTLTDPFSSYTLFPDADSVTSGTLNGSTAHQPLVRVSLNRVARGALQNGNLPLGTRFPNGSVLFKQIMMNGQTALYAIILKDSANPLSANGWLWAEQAPDGTPVFSITRKGDGCVGCHAREEGPAHDHVRTFERQR